MEAPAWVLNGNMIIDTKFSFNKTITSTMTSDNTPNYLCNLPSVSSRHICCLASMLLLLAIQIIASAAAPGSDTHPAQSLIMSTADQMLSALESEGETLRKNPQRVNHLVEKNLLPHIDFEYMSRLVLGRNWSRATVDQRKRFVQEFRQFLIRFYTAALIEYTKGHVIPKNLMQFLPLNTNSEDNKVTVRSEIDQPESTQAIPVNYHLYLRDNQWKVYDVSVDGISMVINYRENFKREIRKTKLDGLIAKLAKRNKELASR